MRALPFIVVLALSLVACGGSDTDTSAESSSEPTTEQADGAGTADQTVTLNPKGNQMKYRQTSFTVAPGATVKLVFDNTATSPSMQHNVVVLTKAPEQQYFQKVGEAGMSAGSTNEYVPSGMEDLILAHTSMAQPGETVSVTFTAPDETGDYGYVCTFPGHWATMQGTMKVRS
jgi:azurin